ncbi:MAG: RNA-directed DNA polymerase [Proteobacteria bacterium]|nr:MAG: RNA-directed DNA polymerase [Pseudomonadota bacterium]
MYIEVMQRKHLSGYRLGSHLSPLALLKFSQLAMELVPAYEEHCTIFDHQQVFFPVFSTTVPWERQTSHAAREMALKLETESEKHGRWILQLDIRNLYGSINDDFLYATLSGASGGLGLHPTLVDELCVVVGELTKQSAGGFWKFEGLPQGYLTSALIARVSLVVLDRELVRLGIPYLRRQDDIFILGNCPADLVQKEEKVKGVLTPLGLTIHEGKRFMSPPKYFDLACRGIHWDLPAEPGDFLRLETSIRLPLSNYIDDRLEDGDIGADVNEELYPLYFRPYHRKRSEGITKWVMVDASSRYLCELVKDIPQITQSRQAVLADTIQALPEDKALFAWRCSQDIPQYSGEHVVRSLLMSAGPELSGIMFSRMLETRRFMSRAVRQSATEFSAEIGVSVLQEMAALDLWPDEAVALIAKATALGRKELNHVYETLRNRGAIDIRLLVEARDYFEA